MVLTHTTGSLLKQTPLRVWGNLSNSGWFFNQSPFMVISTCVVLGLSVASQRYRSLIEFSSLQRSLKGRDYRPPLAACGTAAANTEVEPNLNPPSPAWKLRALFMYLLGHQAVSSLQQKHLPGLGKAHRSRPGYSSEIVLQVQI